MGFRIVFADTQDPDNAVDNFYITSDGAAGDKTPEFPMSGRWTGCNGQPDNIYDTGATACFPHIGSTDYEVDLPQGTDTVVVADTVGWSYPEQPKDGLCYGVPESGGFSYYLSRDPDPPQCGDGIDNDGDGLIDYAGGNADYRDPGCDSATDDSEDSDNCSAVPTAHFGGVWLQGSNSEKFNGATSQPGSLAQITNFQWDYGDGTQGTGVAPVHPYARPGIYDVTLTVTNSCALQDTYSRQVVVNAPETYAPKVVFHPKEKYFPGSAADFIEHSELNWVRYSGSRVVRNCKDDTLAAFGQISPARLGRRSTNPYNHKSTRYSFHHANGARWTECEDVKPYLRANADPAKVAVTSKHAGFLLNSAADKSGDTSLHAPVYSEYVPNRYVIYWFFSPWNGFRVEKFDQVFVERHEADWEHIVVRLDPTDALRGTGFAQHNCPPRTISDAEFVRAPADTAGLEKTHPVVYSARGGHASYPHETGEHYFECKGLSSPFKWAIYDVTGDGEAWKTWRNVRNVRNEPWYGFGGTWGDKGQKGTADACLCVYGPPGPGPGKLSEALPEGW